MSQRATLRDNVEIATRYTYAATESRGPLALVVTSGISLCAVIAILVVMAVSRFKTRSDFVTSQFGAYFLSLVISDLLQATGSVMNIKWVIIKGVSTGSFCTAQAALKQSGNVGTALWSLVIAIHTFSLLFLRIRIGNSLFITILVGVWLLIFFIVIMGPLIIQNQSQGAFWGISGYWCWITAAYRVEQLTDEYLFMFITAGTSFVLYSLIFLRLRGNIQGLGWRLKFRKAKQPWVEDEANVSPLAIMGKQMLWYPVAYTILIAPIAICRWSSIFGHKVPYWATMTADSIFMLSGFVNAILYSTTRKIVSSSFLPSFSRFFSAWSSQRDRGPDSPSKSYLDDMEFASAASPRRGDKSGTRHTSVISDLPEQLRRSSSTDNTEEDGAPQPELSGVVTVSDPEPGKNLQGVIGHDNRPYILGPPWQQTSYSHSDLAFDQGPKMEEVHSAVNKAMASEASVVTTDSTPSLHHKRLSDWSLPSVRGGHSQKSLEGQESLQTELEEMRFAPPSPEPIRKKPLCSDLKWSSFRDLPSVQCNLKGDALQ